MTNREHQETLDINAHRVGEVFDEIHFPDGRIHRVRYEPWQHLHRMIPSDVSALWRLIYATQHELKDIAKPRYPTKENLEGPYMWDEPSWKQVTE